MGREGSFLATLGAQKLHLKGRIGIRRFIDKLFIVVEVHRSTKCSCGLMLRPAHRK